MRSLFIGMLLACSSLQAFPVTGNVQIGQAFIETTGVEKHKGEIQFKALATEKDEVTVGIRVPGEAEHKWKSIYLCLFSHDGFQVFSGTAHATQRQFTVKKWQWELANRIEALCE